METIIPIIVTAAIATTLVSSVDCWINNNGDDGIEGVGIDL